LLTTLKRAAGTIATLIAIIWIVGLVDLFLLGGRLRMFGIIPRTQIGLRGILFAPFLHASVAHLIANTGGLAVFGGLVILQRERHFWSVTMIGALATGIGTWIFGRPAIHIGASGVVFAYFGYLLFIGWFESRVTSLILSVLVFVLWWPTLVGLIPAQSGISWEGHLFGLTGGAFAARGLARKR